MKNILFLLLICAISAHGQAGEITIQSTDESKAAKDFIIYDHKTSLSWLDLDEIEGKKDIESIEINQGGDTLTIYRKWFLYTSPGGPGASCLVFGCNSDHKAHFRDRLIFFEQSGELKFIRREVGELKTVETTTKNTKWVYRE